MAKMKKSKTSNETEPRKELFYRLTNPSYTIYHRAALGGLAATIRAWGNNKPEGIEVDLQSDSVRLSWGDEITEQEALKRILAASFKLTEDKLIDLPGQAIGADQHDLRLAVHTGIMGTFLDHNSAYDAEKKLKSIELKNVDEESGNFFTYKAVNSYAHQTSQERLKLIDQDNHFSYLSPIPKWIVPGAFTGSRPLQAKSDEAILLLFLIVGCAVFLLRPRNYKEKAQYCVVVPDVIGLKFFAQALRRIASTSQNIKRFSNTYLGRVVGGTEEAALRFLIDLHADDIASESSVAGCLAVAMGKVSWDKKNQNNRSVIVKLKGDYPEINIFRAANQHLGKSKFIKSKKGEGYAMPDSPIPELIAANLAAERHWCSNFRSLVSDKKEFDWMKFWKGGLAAMKEAIKDADDQAIIRAFHDAWRLTMRGLGGRERREGAYFDNLTENRRERIRNEILRAKTSELLAGWFLRFCADATRYGPLSLSQDEFSRVRKFIFNPRNFDQFQNLCLFALVSYTRDDSKANQEGGNN